MLPAHARGAPLASRARLVRGTERDLVGELAEAVRAGGRRITSAMVFTPHPPSCLMLEEATGELRTVNAVAGCTRILLSGSPIHG